MVGLDDLRGLFQPMILLFYDSVKGPYSRFCLKQLILITDTMFESQLCYVSLL